MKHLEQARDRQTECFLAELSGRGPAADLAERINAHLRQNALRAVKLSGDSPKRGWSSLTAAIVLLLGPAAVIGVALLQGPRSEVSPAVAQDPEQPSSPSVAQLILRLEKGTLAEKKSALVALVGLRGSAEPALPRMVECMKEPELTEVSLLAVGRVLPYVPADTCEDTYAAIISTVYKPSGYVPRQVRQPIELLAWVKVRAEIDPGETVDRLVERLGSENPLEREFAAVLLGERRAPAALTALLDAVAGPHPKKVRYDILSKNGGKWTRIMDLTRADVCTAAARGVVATMPNDPRAADAYARLLLKGTSEEKRGAAQVLGVMGKVTSAVRQALISTLQIQDPKLLGEAITSVGILDLRDAPVPDLLQELALHNDAQVADRAKATLRSFARDR